MIVQQLAIEHFQHDFADAGSELDRDARRTANLLAARPVGELAVEFDD